MFTYLEKYKKLPEDLRAKIATPEVLATIGELEAKYKINLATLVMRIMIKEMTFRHLPLVLDEELALNPEQSETLTKELKDKVFSAVADYLGIAPIVVPKPAIPFVPEEIIPPVSAPEVLPEFDDYSFKIDNILEEVIRENNIKLSPTDLMKFKNHLRLLARGIRSKIDARTLLLKDFNSAGLGVIAVDKVLQHLDELLKNTFVKPTQKPPAPMMSKIAELNKNNLRFEADYDLRKSLDTKHELKGGFDLSHELSAPLKEFKDQKTLEPQDLKAKTLLEVPVPLAKPEPAIIKTPLPPPPPAPLMSVPTPRPPLANDTKTLNPALRPSPMVPLKKIETFSPEGNSGIKRKVEDIKGVKIMDPIDEMRLLDIVNFRRLGSNPAEVAEKIKARIKLLQGEDYEKGLAAIMAWRQSPINRNYLEIISKALNDNLSLADALGAARLRNPQSLTLEELKAILQLNRELKF